MVGSIFIYFIGSSFEFLEEGLGSFFIVIFHQYIYKISKEGEVEE